MNPPKQHKKIPGIVGLFVLLIGVGVTVYLAGTQTNLFQHAAPSETPQNIRLTNVTDSSFTVTYQTDSALTGTVALDDSGNTQTILDDRDQKTGTPQAYVLHSITAKNLTPATQYAFSILSGTTTYLNNGQKFSIKTAATLTVSPSAQAPLAGKIITNQTTSSEILIFATTSDSQTISTLADSNGLYILPLNTLRTKDLSSYAVLSPTSTLQILAVGSSDKAQAVVSIASSNPVPAMTLGESYDFTQSLEPVASSSATGGFPAFNLDESLRATPQILAPATNDQNYTDAQPLFKGTAPPNEQVTITIHSTDAITKTVTADANGNWSFRPNQPLSPGQHTITISTTNKAGIIQTIQRTFTVYAAGSQVDQSATPSATIAPKPTATPTPKPKATPTPTPKVTVIPTVTPTPTITKGPTSTPTPIPPRPTNLPPTGSNTTVVLGITGIVTTLVGMIIFLLTKGAVL